jgi:hypothetical protein
MKPGEKMVVIWKDNLYRGGDRVAPETAGVPRSKMRSETTMVTVKVYSAAKYVVALRTSAASHKLFQIVFAKDGSLFVTFPYFRSGYGQLGMVHLDPTVTYPTSLTVGENFAATTHYVKYSHHPEGRAHFSLTKKIKSSVGKQASPLFDAEGHVFTVMIQGVDRFDELAARDKGTKKRAVIVFPFDREPVPAIKLLGMLYSESTVAKHVRQDQPTPWMNVITPDGSVLPGMLLHTPLTRNGQRYFLLLSGEPIPTICSQNEVFITLVGGFDPPEVAFDNSKPTSFLMFIYPNYANFEELIRGAGTVDLGRS